MKSVNIDHCTEKMFYQYPGFSLLTGWRIRSTSQTFAQFPLRKIPRIKSPSPTKSSFPSIITIFMLQPNNNPLLPHHFYVNFTYSLYTLFMLILILTDVQYSQNVVFDFEKGLNVQNHSLSDSHHPIKKICASLQNLSSPTRRISLPTP